MTHQIYIPHSMHYGNTYRDICARFGAEVVTKNYNNRVVAFNVPQEHKRAFYLYLAKYNLQEYLHTYTRQQALEDGFLVDVSETAKAAGFRIPVAVTREVWTAIENIPPSKKNWQSVAGRLWDILSMGALKARMNPDHSVLQYRIIMHHSRYTYVTLVLKITPGDSGEPVITIMFPGQD